MQNGIKLASVGERSGWVRRKIERLRFFESKFGEAATGHPEIITLPPRPGAAPAEVVRIFIGTTPSEYVALRRLIWSVRKLRDPDRAYEFHIMANLADYPRNKWSSAYHGYRAATPALAGCVGKVIYCETNTIFLEDPARLLDLNMGESDWMGAVDGGLALLDCEALAPLWQDKELTSGMDPKRIEMRGERSPLPDSWMRGCDTVATTGAALLTPCATGAPIALLAEAFEADADAANFLLFTKNNPTREFGELIALYQQMHDQDFFPGQRLKHHLAPVAALIAESGATMLLDYGAGKAEGYERLTGDPDSSPLRRVADWPGVTVRCFDPGVKAFADLGEESVDGVISTDVVEHLCPWDVAWVLDDIFAHATRFVFVVAACYPAVKRLPDGRNPHTTLQSHDWWRAQMRLAARRHPGVTWRLGCDDRNLFRKATSIYSD